jgi:alkylated DNA repair dioxygenase AlkB
MQKTFAFTSLTIREYHIGQAVGWHIDNPKAGEKIVILSLLSDCIMQFRKDGAITEQALPARSLFIMEGDLRWQYQHRILPVKALRYSIVLRNS